MCFNSFPPNLGTKYTFSYTNEPTCFVRCVQLRPKLKVTSSKCYTMLRLLQFDGQLYVYKHNRNSNENKMVLLHYMKEWNESYAVGRNS